MSDNPYWCDNCQIRTVGIEDMFDPGIGRSWPSVTWCHLCGTIQYGNERESPVMTMGREPTKEQYSRVHLIHKEEMDYDEQEYLIGPFDDDS